ncbi:unnamed protein product [Brugia pahangi]|uniref:Uncharacterized protein n=1 Tax=Brugia pahangi TaxID=6280 RepID=A0A0N4TV10_BRUPA|nr:unnamed protein product [Brugia pahangi]
MCLLGGSRRLGKEGELDRDGASDGHWSPEVHWNDGAKPDWSKGVPFTRFSEPQASSAYVVGSSGDIAGSTSLLQSSFLDLSVHCH